MTMKMYGRLRVISEATPLWDKRGKKITVVNCICECGKKKKIRLGSLASGLTVSCGCYAREVAARVGKQTKTHGMSYRSVFRIWAGILQRCSNENVTGWENYGGRGIKVCERWMKFENFYKDMGDRPSKKHSVDRIDNDGDYEPSNCRWASYKEQARNRRGNVLYQFGGESKTLSEWSDILGIKRTTLFMRINRYKWPIEKAFTEVCKNVK